MSADEGIQPDWLTVGKSFKRPPFERREKGSSWRSEFLSATTRSDGESSTSSTQTRKLDRKRKHEKKKRRKRKKKESRKRRLREGEYISKEDDNLDSDSEDEQALSDNRRVIAMKQQQIGKDRLRSKGDTSQSLTKAWSIDARPDRSILMYGKLYNRDVPLYNDGELNRGDGRRRKWLDNKNESGWGRRYYSPATRKMICAITETEQLWMNAKRRRKNFKDRNNTAAGNYSPHILESTFLPLPAALPCDKTDDDGSEFIIESAEQSFMRKTKEFNEETRNNPKNVFLWLSYAKFLSHSPAYTEKRLAVLQSGLHENPGSVVLWLMYLQAMAAIEPNEQVMDRLFKKGLLKCDQAAAAPLWRAYITYKWGRFSTLDIGDLRDLSAASAEALSTTTCSTDKKTELDRIANVLQICAVEKSAGYAERSMGILQCLVELCFANGEDAQKSLEIVEEFWEDEAPRVGDEGPASAGLCKWLEGRAEKQLLKRKKQVEMGSDSNDVFHKVGMEQPDTAAIGRRSRASDFFADISDTDSEEDLDQTSVRAKQLQPSRHQLEPEPLRSSAARHLRDAYEAALEATAAAVEREALISSSEQAYLEEDHCLEDDVARNGKGSDAEDGYSSDEEQEEAVAAYEKRKEQQEDTVDLDHVVDKQRIALENAVQTEGLIWINEKEGTAYSVAHGRRINIFEPTVDLTSQAHLHHSILKQVRGEAGQDEDGEPSSRTTDALSRRIRRWAARKEIERKREAVVLCPVAKDDEYLVWVEEEDTQSTHQWQPLRSITNPEASEAQPDRVVFWEDIKPYIFCVQTSSGRALIIAALLREAGLHLPLCIASHSSFCLLESEMAYGFDNNFPCSILLGGGGIPGFETPPFTVAFAFTACDQPVWISKELLLSKTRQAFTRNALHTLISSLSLKETDPGLHVHLQCTLLVYEGLLLGSSSSSNKVETNNTQAVPDEEDAAVERVARSLLQASEGSKTDLRIWAAYVRMLEARRKRKEALRVAYVALSTTFSAPTPLPSQYAMHAPYLFWLAFRLKLGLALCSISVASLPKKMKMTTKNAVLELLVGMAEGSYSQASMKKAARQKGVGSTPNHHHHLQISPIRLLSARQSFMERIGTELSNIMGSDDVAGEIHLDSTPPLFYYAAAFAWFQLLTLGVNEAMEAMGSILKHLSIPFLSVCDSWEVQADYGVRSICLSRCHRALCELLNCAIAWNMYGSPQAIRNALLAGLRHFPCDPALLLCFAEIEMYSSHNRVVSGYISKAKHSIRREDWAAGPCAQEWAYFLSVELTRCAAQAANALGGLAAGGGEGGNNFQAATKLCWDVSVWTRGSVARLRRFFEQALGDPTGHGLAFLWRAYIQTEVGAGCHSRAKRLYLRAVHACPGCKELWLDGARTGLLRETLRSEELHDFISASIEKGIFWRAPVPFEKDD